MASLHKLKSGPWQIRWREQGKQFGKAVATKRVAELEHERLSAHESAATPLHSGSVIPLSEIIVRWKKAKIADGRDPLHIEHAAQRILSLIAKTGWKRSDAVTPLAVQDWRGAGSPRTGATLRGILAWSATILDQPVHARSLKLLGATGRPRKPRRTLLTDKTVARILEQAKAFSPSAHAAVHLLVTYGHRPITVARLTVGDCDLKAGTLTMSVKGGDTVQHPLAPATLRLLRPLAAFRDPSEPLLVDPRTDGPWHPVTGLPSWFRKLIAPAHRPASVGIYDLKRYAITSMLRRGLRREQVVVFTGHRVLAQLDTYTVHNEQTKREALAALIAVEQNGTNGQLRANQRKSKNLKMPAKTR